MICLLLLFLFLLFINNCAIVPFLLFYSFSLYHIVLALLFFFLFTRITRNNVRLSSLKKTPFLILMEMILLIITVHIEKYVLLLKGGIHWTRHMFYCVSWFPVQLKHLSTQTWSHKWRIVLRFWMLTFWNWNFPATQYRYCIIKYNVCYCKFIITSFAPTFIQSFVYVFYWSLDNMLCYVCISPLFSRRW